MQERHSDLKEYASNNGAANYVKQNYQENLKGELNKSTIIAGDRNCRTIRQTTNKNTEELNNTVNPQNVSNIDGTLRSATAEYTFKHPWNIHS